jgi:hypothetical protein
MPEINLFIYLGCLSSPCRNGATCVDQDNGAFVCNCTNEYSGTFCEAEKPCVDGFDYCSSLPCLNNGEMSCSDSTSQE